MSAENPTFVSMEAIPAEEQQGESADPRFLFMEGLVKKVDASLHPPEATHGRIFGLTPLPPRISGRDRIAVLLYNHFRNGKLPPGFTFTASQLQEAINTPDDPAYSLSIIHSAFKVLAKNGIGTTGEKGFTVIEAHHIPRTSPPQR